MSNDGDDDDHLSGLGRPLSSSSAAAAPTDDASSPPREEGRDSARGACLYDEAYDMTVLACATHILGKMRPLAREDAARDEAEAGGGDGDGNGDKAKKQRRNFGKGKGAALLSFPVTPRQIDDAIAARGEGAVSFLDGDADFGRKRWSQVNRGMLRPTLLEAAESRDNPPQTWEIVEYGDERAQKELVYSIAVDDVRRRVVVGFRASVTTKDWMTNFNMTYGSKKNPAAKLDDLGGEGGAEQPRKITMHRGFRNYLFQREGKDLDGDSDGDSEEKGEDDNDLCFTCADAGEVRKIHRILNGTARALSDRPGYALYVTGYSLGAGLATIFSLYAAASDDPRIPKPVSCFSIGSPKCGTLSLRTVFAALEGAGRLRYLRIVNEHDLIEKAPLKNQDPNSYLIPSLDFRHVGVALTLRNRGGFCFSYPRLAPDYRRLMMDDNTRRGILLRRACLHFWNHLRGRHSASEIGDHHGYAEYVHRLEECHDGLRDITLDELYREAREGTVPNFWCSCCCPPPEYREGEMTLHYY